MQPALNDEQQQAHEAIWKFIHEPHGHSMYMLKGYAGTGKTFLISRIINAIIEADVKKAYWKHRKIAMTAPTNKAVQVLRESSGLADLVAFKTIHSLLGLKEFIQDSGEIEYKKAYDEDGGSMADFHIVILDEVSMLDDSLFYEVKRWNSQIKIIMMGDPAQIPPVNKVDCEPFLNPKEHDIVEFQLTKIMRQEDGSAIVRSSFDIRDNLQRDGFYFNPGKDLVMMEASTKRDELKAMFTETFTDAAVADHTKVIAWTNAQVGKYNAYIRSLIFRDAVEGNERPVDRLMKGERLVMNQPHECDFIVDEGQGFGDYRRSKFELLTTNQEVIVHGFTELTMDLIEGKYLCYVTSIEYISGATMKPKKGRIKIIHESAEKAFNAKLAEIKGEAIRGPVKMRGATWKRYYNFMRSVADTQYAYAITAHKAQGSTYRETFLDVANIALNPRVVERNRIMYTALTRAKNKATLII